MVLIVIPSRLKSARLPDKPLQLIGGDPLILHCWRRGIEADVGPVHVATDDERIADVIRNAGGNAVLTGDARCGSDRVALAASIIDPGETHGIVVNQQGDMPFISPAQIRTFCNTLGDIREIATAVCNMGMVEVRDGDFFRIRKCLHIGLYAFTRAALRQYHSMGQTPREIEVQLEQLRAVGVMDIRMVELAHMPQEVNTPEDLHAARAMATAVSGR